jgi:hypothetical protein
MSILKVDDKWSIEYDPKNNDAPDMWLRYGEKHSQWEGNNAQLAMFYALLEKSRMKVHVMMENDYPGGVFGSEEAGKKEIAERKLKDQKNDLSYHFPIYRRLYEFEVK